MSRTATDLDSRPWAGPNRHYDIVKEGAIALVVVSILVAGLSFIFSSPDDAALTFKGWAADAPDTLYIATVSELAGSSESAGYGPPYNSNSDGLTIGPLALQKWGGISHPYDSAQDLVINPLTAMPESADVTTALKQWTGASADQQTAWAGDYEAALTDEAGANGDPTAVPEGDYGPVPVLAQALVDASASGAYDSVLLAGGQFFAMDNTKQLLFMGDGGYMEDQAVADHLGGDMWGMMNEAGSWPGQVWLAPASLWYQLPAFNEEGTTLGDNADAIIAGILVVLVLILLFVPFIPGLRSIPRWIPIHRLVWRDWYREHGRQA